ncbi:peptidyl-prolyl cis-trans isomerase [Paenibacillus puldeungensis]|uniref:peptidylprolyl isomerase n=1 Tax=Paenibacillus puldeungensis TaxID=696536 RepID=A0ABW3S173_9BACL
MDEKDKKELETAGKDALAEGDTTAKEGQADSDAVIDGEETASPLANLQDEQPTDTLDNAERVEAFQSDETPVMKSDFSLEQPEKAPQPMFSNKLWPIVSVVLTILLVIVLIKPPFSAKKVEAVATVNGVEITKDQLFKELAAQGGEQVLSQMINEELVNQEAKKQNLQVSSADIDKEIQTYITQYGSEEAFNQALEQAGMTKENLRKTVDMNLKLTKLLEPKIKVTDEQIKQVYDANQDAFKTPEQVRTSVILVKTEAEANDIIKQLKSGADFAELAKSKSLDTATKDKGGDTDFFARGQKEEAVEVAAFKLAKDEISGAVKTSEGYQVLKLTDRKEAHTATLDEKKEEIRNSLVKQQVSSLSQTWIEEQKGKAKITNTLANSTATAVE